MNQIRPQHHRGVAVGQIGAARRSQDAAICVFADNQNILYIMDCIHKLLRSGGGIFPGQDNEQLFIFCKLILLILIVPCPGIDLYRIGGDCLPNIIHHHALRVLPEPASVGAQVDDLYRRIRMIL